MRLQACDYKQLTLREATQGACNIYYYIYKFKNVSCAFIKHVLYKAWQWGLIYQCSKDTSKCLWCHPNILLGNNLYNSPIIADISRCYYPIKYLHWYQCLRHLSTLGKEYMRLIMIRVSSVRWLCVFHKENMKLMLWNITFGQLHYYMKLKLGCFAGRENKRVIFC